MRREERNLSSILGADIDDIMAKIGAALDGSGDPANALSSLYSVKTKLVVFRSRLGDILQVDDVNEYYPDLAVALNGVKKLEHFIRGSNSELEPAAAKSLYGELSQHVTHFTQTAADVDRTVG